MTENGAKLLTVRDLQRSFGGIRAVAGANLDVSENSITALIGPNGAGKTTLFNVVTGFYPAEGGEVRYSGRDITRRRPHEVARLGMVRTFQITKALAGMSVLDNMLLAAPEQPGEHLWKLLVRPRGWRGRETEIRGRAMELLEIFDLHTKAGEYAGTLSGGQRKLLELARVLMMEPRLVLLDEPMAGINPTLARRLLDHMHDLRDRRGVTFFFIEHDMEVVMNNSDRVIVMAQGEVIADGPPAEVRKDQRVIDAYLGGSGNGTEAPE